MRPFLVAGRIWVDLDHVQEIEEPRPDSNGVCFVIRWHCAFRDKASLANVELDRNRHLTNHDLRFHDSIPPDLFARLVDEHWRPFFDAWRGAAR